MVENCFIAVFQQDVIISRMNTLLNQLSTLPLANLTAISLPVRFWLLLLMALHLLGFLFVLFDCLRHRRDPDSALLWIFIAWSLTIVGTLLYLYFGIDRLPSPRHRRNRTDKDLDHHLRECETDDLLQPYWKQIQEAANTHPSSRFEQSLDRAISTITPDHPLLTGNKITPMITGDEAYPPMMAAIRSAKHHIHLESFIIAADQTGRSFMELLREKAAEGVQVRVLYDRFGSTPAVFHRFFKPYESLPNMCVIGFTQANPLKQQFGINLRNHRKILVIDGITGFTGGTNLADENITHDGKQPIHDYHFQVAGPIVHELQHTFLYDWYSMTLEEPSQLLEAEFFPKISSQGSANIRLLNSGPINPDEQSITETFFQAITQAQTQVIAVTPYFVPTNNIMSALNSAAIRGIDVRLIMPQENNHFYAALASKALYEDMLKSGVKIYERHPPFSHAKAMVVDGIYSIIGSANLDVRSLRLNFETCLAIDDEHFAQTLKAILLSDQAYSTRVNLATWRERPLHRKMIENAASLLTPML